jgi:hypothetical protein
VDGSEIAAVPSEEIDKMKRFSFFLFPAAVMSLAISSTLQAKAPAASTPDLDAPATALCRYESSLARGPFFGKLVPMLTMVDMSNGQKLILVCSDDTKPSDPPAWLTTLLKTSKKGDVFKVHYAAVKNAKKMFVMQNMEAYEAKPGENEPNVFIFGKVGAGDEKSGNTPLAVTKFGLPFEFLIPGARGSDNKMVPNEEMMSIVSALKADDPVEILPGRPVKFGKGTVATVRSIKKFDLPKWAKFVKLTKQTVDGKELNAVEVDAYGNSSTLVMKDSALMGTLRPLKPDALIIYKGTTDEKTGTIWLTNVKAAPKDATMPPEPTPATKDSADDTKKPDDTKKKPDEKKPDEKKPAGGK